MSKSDTSSEPPSKLEKFKLYYEFDITYREVKKITRQRRILNGKSS